jgi:MATE family multidrug resistance protein
MATMMQSIKKEVKANTKLSLPLMMSQILYSSSGFLSTIMVAHLGKVALAASVLISMLWFALSVVFFSILNAISVLVAHQFGAKNNKEVGKIMGQGFTLSIILIIMIFAVLQIVPFLLRLNHQSEAINLLSMQYLHGMKFWIPALTFMIMLEQILIGLGKTRIVMIVSGILVPMQVALMYCFIFGNFHFPNTGIAGAGYGIAGADTFGAIFLTLYLLTAKQFKQYELFSHLTINIKYLWEMIRIGLPMGLMSFIEISALSAITYEIAAFGTDQLAAHRIVLQYIGLLITIVFAMSQAVTVRVGHAVGEQNKHTINNAIGVGMLINFILILILAIILFFLARWLVHFDININDAKNYFLVSNTINLFHIVSFLLIFDNFRIIGFGALRGIKDTNFPMLASLISFWGIGISLGYYLGFVLKWQDTGIWFGMTIGILSGAVIVLARIFYKMRNLDLEKILEIK